MILKLQLGGVSPTGYVTADGRDLAEVFLGKQEKAASAATADTATSADSVNWGNVEEKPSIKTGVLRTHGNKISIATSGNWTAPQDMFCDITTQSGNTSGTYVLALNGTTIVSSNLGSSKEGPDALVFVPKGYKLSFKYGSSSGMIKGVAYPYIVD